MRIESLRQTCAQKVRDANMLYFRLILYCGMWWVTKKYNISQIDHEKFCCGGWHTDTNLQISGKILMLYVVLFFLKVPSIYCHIFLSTPHNSGRKLLVIRNKSVVAQTIVQNSCLICFFFYISQQLHLPLILCFQNLQLITLVFPVLSRNQSQMKIIN